MFPKSLYNEHRMLPFESTSELHIKMGTRERREREREQSIDTSTPPEILFVELYISGILHNRFA